MGRFIPEVLAPAGSLEKLKVAVDYGADAVYLAGLKFGLRTAADNFTYQELQEGVDYAHNKNAKVYVVINGFLHDEDLQDLPAFVEYITSIGVDAVIVSDLGTIQCIKNTTNIPIHLSTQASCLNHASAKLWKRMGVERVVLGREVSIQEAGKIKKEAQVEVEMFIQGSMCMAYSGNCVISNFTQGRDSNRGGCAHSCRFEYGITPKGSETKYKSYFMSSKDLNGLEVVEQFIVNEIDSLKIEGRMKSHLYAATMSKGYSEVLKQYSRDGVLNPAVIKQMNEELEKVPHRSYTKASLIEKADAESIFNERETSSENSYVLVGQVLEVATDSHLLVQVRNAFNLGDTIETLALEGETVSLQISQVTDLVGNDLERTKPSTLVKIPYHKGVRVNTILRQQVQA